MDEKKNKIDFLTVFMSILLTITTASTGWFGYRNILLLEENEQLLSTQKELEEEAEVRERAYIEAQNSINELNNELRSEREELQIILSELQEERNRNEDFEDQIRNLAGTVGTLDRLAQTDRELLQKYSRTFFLNENYRPAQLTQIPQRCVMPGRQDQYFLPEAWPFLEDMLKKAERDGHDLRIISAFRSFDEQVDLKSQFLRQYGTGANTFSADQGFSEHQLGTAIDIVDLKTGATEERFSQTEAYEWLKNNAHRYGFILSYPPDNDYYIYEPWHWRFVGRKLASDLNRRNMYFYDMDQREINTYLIYLFD